MVHSEPYGQTDRYMDLIEVTVDLARDEFNIRIRETYDSASWEVGAKELLPLVEHLAGLLGKKLIDE